VTGLRNLRIAALALVMGCSGGSVTSNVITDTGEAADFEPPLIQHTPITTAQAYGMDIPLNATADDPAGVLAVEVFYRQETSSEWKSRSLEFVGGNLYQGIIPGDDVASAGMRYYLEASDMLENGGCLPVDCELEPFGFSVSPF
jgi:hypothetical protein